jgi:predicted nuclease with RNAse H fold/uncharacterized protein YprB with RNaseH-like and TPR domain
MLIVALSMTDARMTSNRGYLKRRVATLPAASDSLPDILPRTFVHLPGIGFETEQRLWKRGITSWSELAKSADPLARTVRERRGVGSALVESTDALKKRDVRFFAESLPRTAWWRLYGRFRATAVFLDIETTGLSHYYDDITVIGALSGAGFKTIIGAQNLAGLSTLLAGREILVTFNGTLFDLRFLREKLSSLTIPAVHLDMRFLLSRLGYRGTLKAIEQQLRIKRVAEAQSIDGLAATVLWARFVRGDVAALKQLLLYNAADVSVLQSLAEFAYRRFAAEVMGRASRTLPVRPRTFPVCVLRETSSAATLRVGSNKVVVPMIRLKPKITMPGLVSRLPNPQKLPRVIGIDLTGSAKRPSGWAIVVGTHAEANLVDTDENLLHATISAQPDLVSIDAPLGLPRGRCCASDSCGCRRVGIARECERILWKRGVRVYPCLLPSMQALTLRGIRLATRLRELGIDVIESYPGAAQDIMRIPRKRASLVDLREGLMAFGLDGLFVNGASSHDELDAITSALVGYFYLTGDAEELGSREEGPLVVPKLQ